MSVLPEVRDQSAAYSLLDLIQGSVVSQAISVAAQLGIADVLGNGPMKAEEIATRVGADPEATYRLMRTLAGYSVFTIRPDERFELTPIGEALREDGQDSMRGMAVLLGHPLFQEEWGYLLETIRTGEANLPKLRGMDALSFLSSKPDYASVFFQGMGCVSSSETDPVVASYDFSQFQTIVDVIGGHGTLLAGILGKAPQTRGILFDAESVTRDSAALFKEAGVADRVTIEEGGHFDKLPAGADAYILKHILHDFTKPQCLTFLRNVRDAIAPDGKVLIIEYVLKDDNTKHIGNIIDLWLMLLLGAKERTLPQYAELCAQAGLEVIREVPTSAPVSIVEARPV